MKDARKNNPLDHAYAVALGMATYCFAICEWNVVWCCERIKPGTLRTFLGDKKFTAGMIGEEFENLVRNMPPSEDRKKLAVLADEFLKLVKRRNAFIHGKPCTAPGPEKAQRLSSGHILEIGDLEDAADAFAECSTGLNELLHGFLAQQWPQIQSTRKKPARSGGTTL